ARRPGAPSMGCAPHFRRTPVPRPGGVGPPTPHRWVPRPMGSAPGYGHGEDIHSYADLEDPDMSLDVPRTEPRPGSSATEEIRRRLEHARSTRLAQLKALDEESASPDDPLTARQREA